MAKSEAAFDYSYFRSRDWWRDETLRDWFEKRTRENPEQIAIQGFTGSLSYGEFRDRALSLAAGLRARGIAQGDTVAVHLPNIPEFLISWLAINELGAAMQTVHTPYGQREIEQLLKHSGARACIALAKTKDRSPAAEIDELRASLPNLKLVISVGECAQHIASFDSLIALGATSSQTLQPLNSTDNFLLLYTSGTTSSPKGVSVTYNHFLSNARMCATELGITAADRILCLAPFTHLYGLYALQLGFSVGATACLLDVFSPPGFIQALKAFKPTILLAGPAHVSPCLQQRLFDTVDFSDMRIAILSGSTVPAALSAAFEEKLTNGKVLQAWGMTELQFGACSRPNDPIEIRFQTIGRATPGTELRIADSEGQIIPHGETGELQVRGCSLFSGYVGNDEATRASFSTDGWLRTGDLAKMDAAGNVQLCGRTKELINRGGVKFNPIDMEIALSGHPAIAQVAIAPAPDQALGERACCFVVLRAGSELSFTDLKSFLAERKFAKFTWPENLVIVSEMPMTPTRKIMKSELVRRYAP